MRKIPILIFLLFAALVLSGCKDNPVQEYGNALTDAYKNVKKTGANASLAGVEKSIAAFHASEGRYPANLDEISSVMGARIDPQTYDYDPSTGSVALRGNAGR